MLCWRVAHGGRGEPWATLGHTEWLRQEQDGCGHWRETRGLTRHRHAGGASAVADGMTRDVTTSKPKSAAGLEPVPRLAARARPLERCGIVNNVSPRFLKPNYCFQCFDGCVLFCACSLL